MMGDVDGYQASSYSHNYIQNKQHKSKIEKSVEKVGWHKITTVTSSFSI